jgi:rSAM/selenodomain-associated transferase 1
MENSPHKHQSIEWIVLTKAPIPGTVKTRLIIELGDQGACDLYIQLLKRLENTLKNLVSKTHSDVALWIAGDDQHEVFIPWQSFATFYRQPNEADLGGRMSMAVQSALARGRIPVLIGVDVPSLDEAYLMKCLQQLKNYEVVISPAEDGGYGLLGMKQFYAELFEGKAWGTDSVFHDTLNTIETLQLSVAYLPKVWDVDEPVDVGRWLKVKELL